MANNLTDEFYNLLRLTREYEKAPDWASGLKLGEECGEVQAAILKGQGFLHHKVLDEDVVHEISDVMNVCCAILTAHYPDLTPTEISTELAKAMQYKAQKYAALLGAPNHWDAINHD